MNCPSRLTMTASPVSRSEVLISNRSGANWISTVATPRNSPALSKKGAERAIKQGGKSLLPVGVTACRGYFNAGDVVRVENSSNAEVARGLCRYASEDIERILGKSSPEVEAALGKPALEVIHRDDLVII